jgi:hypothetical protein
VTSFALGTRKEKYDEASVYVYIYEYIYKVVAALRMLNNAICNYCSAVRSLANDANIISVAMARSRARRYAKHIIVEKPRPSPAGGGQWADDNDVGNW